MSKDFFKRNTNNRGEGRELYKTPLPIIKKIVESILEHYPELKSKLWIDPCAGDGRWADIIDTYGIKTKSYDIKPLSNKVIQQDFYKLFSLEDCFIIGNPPFSQLKKFIEKALSLTDKCYFLGGSQIITGTLSTNVELLHRFEGFEGNQKDKRSKIKFIDTNNENVMVWCCGALFSNRENEKFVRSDYLIDNSFRTSIKSYTIEDDRVIGLKEDK